jgi:hypothetical protein
MALGGFCSARFGPLRDLFATQVESGDNLGASLAVNINGEMVVDLCPIVSPIAAALVERVYEIIDS